MDEVKRKVFLDLFAAPGTLLPVAGGVTLLLASWAMGGNAVFNFGGFASILGGVGIFATRMILGLDQITNRAYEYVLQKQRTEQEQKLEELDRKLSEDDDPRTETCLRALRHLYDSFRKDLQDGILSGASFEVLDGVDRLFHVCIRQLQQSHELWQTAGRLQGPARETLLREREEIVREVHATVEHLQQTMERWHTLAARKKKTELAGLRSELDESLRAARRAEERVAAIEKEVVGDAEAERSDW